MPRQRIASLVPSATEALFALGLGDRVVAVTHECDHPAAARELPQLTRSMIEPGLAPGDVDSRVRELTGSGDALYELDADRLAAAEPNLIVTQAVCPVCAVSYEQVAEIAAGLPGAPEVVSLDPERLGDVLGDLERLGRAVGEPAAGIELRERLERRIERVKKRVGGLPRPRVAVLEWLDPPFLAGHWAPEMVEAAGGVAVGVEPGGRSPDPGWEAIAALEPEVAIVAPCGLDADAAAGQARQFADRLAGLGTERNYAVDAAASFSRPGPRLVDGIELLAHLLHPNAAPDPGSLGWSELDPAATRPATVRD